MPSGRARRDQATADRPPARTRVRAALGRLWERATVSDLGRGIRLGLEHCAVCGAAHEAGEEHCPTCTAAVGARDRETLVARNLESISGRFGKFVKKDPD